MKMHRKSYSKTISLALFVLLVCVLLVPLLHALHPHWVAGLLAIIALAATSFLALLTMVGGCICLWRDAREVAGVDDPLRSLATDQTSQKSWTKAILRRFSRAPYHPGDLVQVKSLAEIESTLDAKRTLAGLPFMAEMESFCGGTYRVHRRVYHVNDMRNKTGLRRLRSAVTLQDIRCSGAEHGGCQAECQVLWKDAWLAPAQQSSAPKMVERHTLRVESSARPISAGTVYSCQMTSLWEATEAMSPFDIRQDLRTLISGNFTLRAFLIASLTRLFNEVQFIRGGSAYPYMPPQLADRAGVATPTAELGLSPGDEVVVRTKDEIARTLVGGKNRGLWFDREMIRFCQKKARVRRRVTHIIHERTGQMVEMKSPTIVLEDICASGEFLRLCPQHDYIFWREIWLMRASADHIAGTRRSS